VRVKSAVVYATMSGNTREVAEIIAAEAKAELVPMSANPPDLRGYELLFIGSYTWGQEKRPTSLKTSQESSATNRTMLRSLARATLNGRITVAR
jgi:flavodoxin